MQEVLSALAGTHWHQYNQFSRDVDEFRRQTQRFYYPKMASEQTYRTFSVADAAAIPQFRPREYAGFAWLPVGSLLLGYAAVVAGLGLVGYRRLLSASR